MAASVLAPLEQIAMEFDRGQARNPVVMLESLNQFYDSNGIPTLSNLDDLQVEHIGRQIESLLDVPYRRFGEMQDRLIELNMFSPDMKEYSGEIQRKIIEGIVSKMSSNFSSFYLDNRNPNREKNRIIIAKSDQLKDYMNANGFFHLDNFTSRNKTGALGSVLGIDSLGVLEGRERLVEMDVFSENLEEYVSEAQGKAIENIIANIQNRNFSSFYIREGPYLETSRKIIANSSQMSDYLRSIGVEHLDNITSRTARANLANILGFDYKTTSSMQDRFVELGTFSARIEDHSEEKQGKILDYIINKKPVQNSVSYYLQENNPNLEDNRRFIVSSQQFKDYLSGKGITNPDSVTSSNKLLENILGVGHNRVTDIRKNLVEYGTFSGKIDEYTPEVQEEIIGKAIKEKRLESYFLSSDNQHSEHNRNLIATSDAMKNYLLSLGIDHLDQIAQPGLATNSRLANILGFNIGRRIQMKKRLVELGHYSLNIADYTEEVQESIIESIFNKMGTKGISIAYLSDDNPNLESNRQIIADSPKTGAYLSSIGVKHLDDIDKTIPTGGFGSVLGGFRVNQPKNMQKRLVELGVYSPDLSDSSYDSLREDISQKLVDTVSTPKPSYYTSPDLDETVLQSNREIILASNAVQRFFAEQRYDMNDPSTMNNKVRLFSKKYFGTDDADVFVSRTKKEELPLYRRIHKEWSQAEEERLLLEYERVDSDESTFIGMLSENRDTFQEIFGVSYRAIIEKCRYMGLIPSNELEGSRENGIPVYAFPSIHGEEFPAELEGFENYARLLASNITPAATPAFAFTSATHEQFDAVTLPIWYRGTEPTDYTPAEQAILSSVQHYISDNSRFQTRENGDSIIDPSTPHDMDPRILQIEGEHNKLVQLIFRKRFNPDNKIATTAIDMGHGRDVYVFQHELTPTYQNTRAA